MTNAEVIATSLRKALAGDEIEVDELNRALCETAAGNDFHSVGVEVSRALLEFVLAALHTRQQVLLAQMNAGGDS